MAVDSGTIRFLKQPATVALATNIATLSAQDQLLEANNPTLEFKDHTVRKIIKACRRIVLENIESGRYQSNVNEQQLRVN